MVGRSAGAIIEEIGLAGAGRALDLAGVALLAVDPDLQVLELNETAAALLGRAADEVRGTPLCPDLVDAVVCTAIAEALRGGEEVTFEGVCPLRRDPDFWCEVRCLPLEEAVVVVVRDVTERRMTEMRYRSIVETAADGILVIDEDGVIASINSAAERIFGYSSEELAGRNVSLLMPEPVRSEHDSYLRRYLEGGPARIIGVGREVLARRKDGSTFPLHLAVGEMWVGGRRMFTGILRDETERTRVEEELRRIEVRSRMLSEQSALRRVATAVAAEEDPQRVFDLVAQEVALLLGVSVGLICRFQDGVAEIVGRWSSGPALAVREVPLEGAGVLARVRRTGRPARADAERALGEDPVAALVGAQLHATAAAPIPGRGAPWGAVLAATTRPSPLPAGAEYQLADFAELVAMAVSNAEDRARLAALAAWDPLTGLPNHRTFQERLRDEAARAARHGHPLAVVAIDLDHFRQVNEAYGHDVGDRVLVEVARRLRGQARAGEVVARVGGEEFAWILPETDMAGAHRAAERARRAIEQLPVDPVGTVTISAGVCDLAHAGDAEELFRLADGALYWAKQRGRNTVCDYEAGSAGSLSPAEKAARLEQAQTRGSIRVLARAVDAKDPSTQEHSTRVAELAVRLATALGWPAERLARLHEAGLLHDVGKIGVPDAILFKPGRLTADEYEVVKSHAELGARIIADVVTPEQTAWVRHHHERMDGSGYPDGLTGDAIPDGARILALADAWDVMTAERPYKAGRLSPEEALLECRRHAGTQFCPVVVAALERLFVARALPPGDAPDSETPSPPVPARAAGAGRLRRRR